MYRQFCTKNKIKIIRLIPLLLTLAFGPRDYKTSFNLVSFYFNIRGILHLTGNAIFTRDINKQNKTFFYKIRKKKQYMYWQRNLTVARISIYLEFISILKNITKSKVKRLSNIKKSINPLIARPWSGRSPNCVRAMAFHLQSLLLDIAAEFTIFNVYIWRLV